MNKIITTSLLLLAGTALSQAATAVWAIGTSSATDSPYYYETTGSGYTAIQYSNGTTSLTTIPSSLLTSSAQDGFTLGYQNSQSGRYWGASTSASEDYSGELAWALHNVTGLSYSTLNSLLDSYTGAYCGTGGTVTLTFSGLTSGTTYTVALVATNNAGTGALTLSSGGTITSAYYGTVGSDSWDEATISSGNISVTTSNASFTAVCLTFTATSDSVSFTSTNKGGFALAAITTDTVAIPEPSAFGLLAGLGALVLVASRRRRSRRAA